MKKNNQISLRKIILSNLILIIISVLVFVFAHPDPVIKNGLGILGFIIYWPVLILVNKDSLKYVWLTGGIYGALAYGIYGYWLHSFHPLGLLIVCVCYFFICAVLFTGLKLIDLFFVENGWLVQWLFICGYEYLKTTGFLGFSYGVTAYTQWRNIYFIQCCDLFGVFGLNLIIIFLSCWIYYAFGREVSSKVLKHGTFTLWALCVICCYVYGFVDIKKTADYETVEVAAIQNNEDPWKNGIDEYSKNIQRLKTLTNEALELYPDADIILWPETAVVPSILYHYYYGNDAGRRKIINSLLSYMDSKNKVFVIGNCHEVVNKGGKRERYNSAFVFESGKNVYLPDPDVYSKIHLVPFTEYFPYKNYFPALYIKLLNGDTHMWEKGNEYVVFENNNLKYSTPICFEDTFGEDCRHFVLEGARCFLNMSNDAWSRSAVCQKQHLAMAVFRSVENKVPSVRSTASGITCIINQHGKVEKMAPEFCETYVVGKVPVIDDMDKPSFYTRYGDYAGKAAIILTAGLLIIQLFTVIIKKLSKK